MGSARIEGDRRLLAPLGPLRARLARHEALLWWAHSAYVLALGAGIVWLGARNFAWLRFAGFYLLAIWLLSLFLANVVQGRDGVWWRRARFMVNYVNKNLYQQLLFFILPIYAGSATLSSRNAVFLVVLGAFALLSTLDLVYDRVVSARRALSAWFYAFNVFAVVNVALPVLFGVSAHWSLRLSAVAAALGFFTIAWRVRRLGRGLAWTGVAASAALVFGAGEVMRPFVPPAPLRLTATEFGTGLDRPTLRVTGSITALPPGFRGRVFVVTAVRAPLGLKDRVELRWYRGGQLLRSSSAYSVSGGRREGFRLWSAIAVGGEPSADPIRLDVVTEAGQIIGRAVLPSKR